MENPYESPLAASEPALPALLPAPLTGLARIGAIANPERRELAIGLRELFGGAITNDQFDDRYYSAWYQSADPAVRDIASFGWSHYSDSHRYRLRGWNAPSNDSLDTADRCILYLHADLPYVYPPDVEGVTPYLALMGPGFWLIVGAVLLLIAGLSGGSILFCLLGMACMLPTALWAAKYNSRRAAEAAFRAAGDTAVWPFACREDFDAAQGTHPDCWPPT
jgi:hypothetical protein